MSPVTGGTAKFSSMRSLSYRGSRFVMAGSTVNLFKFFRVREVIKAG